MEARAIWPSVPRGSLNAQGLWAAPAPWARPRRTEPQTRRRAGPACRGTPFRCRPWLPRSCPPRCSAGMMRTQAAGHGPEGRRSAHRCDRPPLPPARCPPPQTARLRTPRLRPRPGAPRACREAGGRGGRRGRASCRTARTGPSPKIRTSPIFAPVWRGASCPGRAPPPHARASWNSPIITTNSRSPAAPRVFGQAGAYSARPSSSAAGAEPGGESRILGGRHLVALRPAGSPPQPAAGSSPCPLGRRPAARLAGARVRGRLHVQACKPPPAGNARRVGDHRRHARLVRRPVGRVGEHRRPARAPGSGSSMRLMAPRRAPAARTSIRPGVGRRPAKYSPLAGTPHANGACLRPLRLSVRQAAAGAPLRELPLPAIAPSHVRPGAHWRLIYANLHTGRGHGPQGHWRREAAAARRPGARRGGPAGRRKTKNGSAG